jgi:putative peptidoglycan lipid II flippase
MVSLASLDYLEMGRCLLAGLLSGSVVWIAIWSMKGLFAKGLFSRLPGAPSMLSARLIDLAVLLVGTAVWLAVTKVVLEKSGSALPRVALKRLGLA